MKVGGDSDSDPDIAVGKGKGKGVWDSDSESSDSESQVPISSTGVKRGRAAPESGAPAGKRKKKTSPSPHMGWSGTGQESGEQGSLPLRIVTQVSTVLDYVKGTGHRPRCWMRSFPLIQGGGIRGQGS